MSRYTHRTAISNSRIISIEDNTIRFRYKDYKDNNRLKTMKLTSDEFIKRFLYHTDIELFNQYMADWLIDYNTFIPHHSLNMKTPVQYLLDNHIECQRLWTDTKI